MQDFDQNCSKLFQGCYPRIPLGGRGHPLPHRSPSQPKLSNPNILDARPPLRTDTTSRRRPSLALSTRRQTNTHAGRQTPLLVPRRPHTVSPYSYIPLHRPDRTRPDPHGLFLRPGSQLRWVWVRAGLRQSSCGSARVRSGLCSGI